MTQNPSVAMPNLDSPTSKYIMKKHPYFNYVDYNGRQNVADILHENKEDFMLINS